PSRRVGRTGRSATQATQEPGNARVRLAGVHLVRGPELPDPEGNPRGRAPRPEEVLSARAEAHAAQGIAEEVSRRAAKTRRPAPARASGIPWSVRYSLGIVKLARTGRGCGQEATARELQRPGTLIPGGAGPAELGAGWTNTSVAQ